MYLRKRKAPFILDEVIPKGFAPFILVLSAEYFVLKRYEVAYIVVISSLMRLLSLKKSLDGIEKFAEQFFKDSEKTHFYCFCIPKFYKSGIVALFLFCSSNKLQLEECSAECSVFLPVHL